MPVTAIADFSGSFMMCVSHFGENNQAYYSELTRQHTEKPGYEITK